MSTSTDDVQQAILMDIRSKTGIQRSLIGGLDTSQEQVAQAVLPILAEWVPLVRDKNLRWDIYARFGTSHANRFLTSMVSWAETEQDRSLLEVLHCAIAIAARPADAEWLWSVTRGLQRSPNYCLLLAKLAKFPKVATQIKEKLATELRSSQLGFAELRAISDVDDPRIFSWFEDHVNSPDKRLRALARTVTDRGKGLPPGVAYAPSEPGHGEVLYSAEFELDETEGVLKNLTTDFRLIIPKPIRNGRFLSRLPLNRWTVVNVRSRSNESVCIYFRLEDFDRVEILLVQPGEPQSTPGGSVQ
jgi:hypothetical protein